MLNCGNIRENGAEDSSSITRRLRTPKATIKRNKDRDRQTDRLKKRVCVHPRS